MQYKSNLDFLTINPINSYTKKSNYNIENIEEILENNLYYISGNSLIHKNYKTDNGSCKQAFSLEKLSNIPEINKQCVSFNLYECNIIYKVSDGRCFSEGDIKPEGTIIFQSITDFINYCKESLNKLKKNKTINYIVEIFKNEDYIHFYFNEKQQALYREEVINLLTNNNSNYSQNIMNYFLSFIHNERTKAQIHPIYNSSTLHEHINDFSKEGISHIIPVHSLEQSHLCLCDHYALIILNLQNFKHYYFDPGLKKNKNIDNFLHSFGNGKEEIKYNGVNLLSNNIENSGPYIIEWISNLCQQRGTDSMIYVEKIDINKIIEQHKNWLYNGLQQHFKHDKNSLNFTMLNYNEDNSYTNNIPSNNIIINNDFQDKQNIINNLVDNHKKTELYNQYNNTNDLVNKQPYSNKSNNKMNIPFLLTDSIPDDKQDIEEEYTSDHLKKRKITTQSVNPIPTKKNTPNKSIIPKKSNSIFNTIDNTFQPKDITVNDYKKYNLDVKEDVNDLCKKCHFKYIEFDHQNKTAYPSTNYLFRIAHVNALQQEGAFAEVATKANKYFGCYSGTIYKNISNEINNKQMDLSYQFETTFQNQHYGHIDALKQGNGMRFFNNSQDPNIKAQEVKINDMVHIHFKSIKTIKPGDQLMIKYGFKYFALSKKPQLYMNPNDNWHTPAEKYQFYKEQYAIGQYALTEEIIKVFELHSKTFVFPKILLAMLNSDLKSFKKLLKKNDPNLPILGVENHQFFEDDKQEYLTTLHLACYLAKYDYIQVLLSNKATYINAFARHTGYTPLFATVLGKGSNEIVYKIAKALFKKTTCYLTYDKNYYTILHFAIKKNLFLLVKKVFDLIEFNQDEDFFKNILKYSPNTTHANFDYCIKHKYFDIFSLLLKHIDIDFFFKAVEKNKILNPIHLSNLSNTERLELYNILINYDQSKKLNNSIFMKKLLEKNRKKQDIQILECHNSLFFNETANKNTQKEKRKNISEDVVMNNKEEIPPLTSEKIQFGFHYPTKFYLTATSNMPVSGNKNQYARLTFIKNIIKKNSYRIIKEKTFKNFSTPNTINESTKHILDEKTWEDLFKLINLTSKEKLEKMKDEIDKTYLSIAENDPLLNALESIHDQVFLLDDVIPKCIKSTIEKDVAYSPTYFQAALQEINEIANAKYDLLVNIGLPSQHAFMGSVSSSCIINKLAVLMAYEKSKYSNVHFSIIGLGLYQCNGLLNCLMGSKQLIFKESDIQHIDIYDSRLFPKPEIDKIEEELKKSTNNFKKIVKNNLHFISDNYEYSILDLSIHKRKKNEDIHPIILECIYQVKNKLNSIKHNEKIMLIIPLGLASHQEEEIDGGKFIETNKELTNEQNKNERFSDKDMKYFYDTICQLKKIYGKKIHKILISLESGYSNKLIKNQIELLNKSLEKNFNPSKENGINNQSNNTNNNLFLNTPK